VLLPGDKHIAQLRTGAPQHAYVLRLQVRQAQLHNLQLFIHTVFDRLGHDCVVRCQQHSYRHQVLRVPAG
jgi:hypothetical protein